jgi:hypothetical protein
MRGAAKGVRCDHDQGLRAGVPRACAGEMGKAHTMWGSVKPVIVLLER